MDSLFLRMPIKLWSHTMKSCL